MIVFVVLWQVVDLGLIDYLVELVFAWILALAAGYLLTEVALGLLTDNS